MTTPDELERAVERVENEVFTCERGGLIRAPVVTLADLRLLLSERAELLATVERMRVALEGFVEGIERAPISWETGCCCCGSPVDSHGFGDGHSPVDEGVYFITQLIKAARAALTTGEEK